MARSERRYRLYNRILFAVGMAALSLLTLWNLTGKLPAALALEQETRCGMNEHLHTDACYLGDVLVCGQKAHTHSESCYLVLLEDNDVNQLLTAVDSTKGKSLENVIEATLVQAMVANGVETPEGADLSFVGGTEDTSTEVTPSPSLSADPSPTPSRLEDPSPTPSRLDSSSTQEEDGNDVATLALTNLSVTDLNTTIEEEEIEPSLTLNSNLYAVATLASTDTEAIADNSISTLAVDGEEGSNSNNDLNIYVRLDDDWLFVGTKSFSVNYRNKTYTPYLAQATLTSTITEYMTASNHISGTVNSPTVYYADYGETYDNSAQAGTGRYNNATSYTFGSYSTRNNNNAYDEAYASKNAYADLQFYTVTLDYSQLGTTTANEVQYVQSGQNSNLSLSDEYLWYDAATGGTRVTTATPGTITSKVTLYARPKNVTVTFESNGGTAVESQTVKYNSTIVEPDSPTLADCTFGGWYTDNTYYITKFDFTTTVKESLTLYAKWECTVSLIYNNSEGQTTNASTSTVGRGTTITLDETYNWKDDDGNTFENGETVTITKNTEFVGTVKTFTITIIDEAGATTSQTVEYGKTVDLNKLPNGYSWVGNDGSVYESGATTDPITEDVIFTATQSVTAIFVYQDTSNNSSITVQPGTAITLPAVSASGNVWMDEDGTTYFAGDSVVLTTNQTFTEKTSLTVSYDVNFPMSGYSFYYTVTAPSASPTISGMTTSTGSVSVAEGSTATVRTVSQTIVRLDTSHGKDFTYPVLFKGWESESGDLIYSYSRLSWTELQGYDEDGDGVVELTGVWDHGIPVTANFFILHNAKVDQTTGDADDYTTSIYSTAVVNSDSSLSYTASDDAAALANDGYIRKMYGERSDEMWFSTFPSDKEIFDALNDHVDDLTVGDIQVEATDLNTNEYAIRWYQMVYNSDDGWHIDGKLVRKVGVIDVTKTFSGNETLLDAAKENFSITAVNVDGQKSHTLTLDNATDGGNNTYSWQITDVDYDEKWTLTETAGISDAIHYAEWAITDSSVNSQTANGSGPTTSLYGVTYANDLADVDWPQVAFNNIYYHKDSLMIKKADAVTGEALSGAKFVLSQNGAALTFDYNSETGLYEYNKDGEYSILTGSGYINLATTGFSFDTGNITVTEITAPENYNPVGAIEIGYTDSAKTAVGIVNEDDCSEFAEYQDGLLIVKNSTNTLNVTARKHWDCDEEEWADVTVQLFANDNANLAATLTGTTSAVVTLTDANDYSFTWTNLPIYAYGTEVEWSIRETKVGNEACKSDYTFANWAVSYDAAQYDADGNVTLVVHNTPKRPMLYLTKTNFDGSTQLSGATFTLIQVDENGNAVDGFVPRVATTNELGILIFDNLMYGVRYKITEDMAPAGYAAFTDPIYLTIAEGGVITLEAHDHARTDAVAYNIFVSNDGLPVLPETGGSGTGVYMQTGLLLMISAVALLVYQKLRRREVDLPNV